MYTGRLIFYNLWMSYPSIIFERSLTDTMEITGCATLHAGINSYVCASVNSPFGKALGNWPRPLTPWTHAATVWESNKRSHYQHLLMPITPGPDKFIRIWPWYWSIRLAKLSVIRASWNERQVPSTPLIQPRLICACPSSRGPNFAPIKPRSNSTH